MKRDIVSWKDPAILGENPLLEQLADSDTGITVVRQNMASPITQGLTEVRNYFRYSRLVK
jgi:hypothetical protein